MASALELENYWKVFDIVAQNDKFNFTQVDLEMGFGSGWNLFLVAAR